MRNVAYELMNNWKSGASPGTGYNSGNINTFVDMLYYAFRIGTCKHAVLLPRTGLQNAHGWRLSSTDLCGCRVEGHSGRLAQTSFDNNPLQHQQCINMKC